MAAAMAGNAPKPAKKKDDKKKDEKKEGEEEAVEVGDADATMEVEGTPEEADVVDDSSAGPADPQAIPQRVDTEEDIAKREKMRAAAAVKMEERDKVADAKARAAEITASSQSVSAAIKAGGVTITGDELAKLIGAADLA